MKPCLVDVNVWIALAYSDHVLHERARRWFEELAAGDAAFCRLTQVSFLRLLTGQAVLGDDAQTMNEAWRIYSELQADPRVAFRTEPAGLEALFRSYTQSPARSPQLWADAYLTAFANASGLALATFDKAFANRGEVEDLVMLQASGTVQ